MECVLAPMTFLDFENVCLSTLVLYPEYLFSYTLSYV